MYRSPQDGMRNQGLRWTAAGCEIVSSVQGDDDEQGCGLLSFHNEVHRSGCVREARFAGTSAGGNSLRHLSKLTEEKYERVKAPAVGR